MRNGPMGTGPIFIRFTSSSPEPAADAALWLGLLPEDILDFYARAQSERSREGAVCDPAETNGGGYVVVGCSVNCLDKRERKADEVCGCTKQLIAVTKEFSKLQTHFSSALYANAEGYSSTYKPIN